jgi:hypothetical protein
VQRDAEEHGDGAEGVEGVEALGVGGKIWRTHRGKGSVRKRRPGDRNVGAVAMLAVFWVVLPAGTAC